jgi:hypothetical protein
VAHGIDLLRGQRIDGTSITAAEHDLPEVVRCQQPMRAALGGHDNITDPNGSKQVIECVGGDQIVPRIEGAIEVRAKPPNLLPEEAIARLEQMRTPGGDSECASRSQVPPHLSNKAMPVSGEEDTEDAHDGVERFAR